MQDKDSVSSSKNNLSQTDRISCNPLTFGSRNELRIALTELAWIRKIKKRVSRSDFKLVSEKYRFPTEFLERGFNGFSYPEDFMISKSRWFPVIYSWVINERQQSEKILKLNIDYIQSRRKSIYYLLVLIILFYYVFIQLQATLKLDFIQLLLQLAIPFVLFLIPLFAQVRTDIIDKKMKLEECSSHLIEIGSGHIVDSNKTLIRQLGWRIYARNIFDLTQKYKNFTVFTIKSEEKTKIPILYGENPDEAYRRRIEELYEQT